ncbi:unnamed protein product [[Candida] boidinii]|nr:unnamed protein product [[Candida] boidinii]
MAPGLGLRMNMNNAMMQNYNALAVPQADPNLTPSLSATSTMSSMTPSNPNFNNAVAAAAVAAAAAAAAAASNPANSSNRNPQVPMVLPNGTIINNPAMYSLALNPSVNRVGQPFSPIEENQVYVNPAGLSAPPFDGNSADLYDRDNLELNEMFWHS